MTSTTARCILQDVILAFFPRCGPRMDANFLVGAASENPSRFWCLSRDSTSMTASVVTALFWYTLGRFDLVAFRLGLDYYSQDCHQSAEWIFWTNWSDWPFGSLLTLESWYLDNWMLYIPSLTCMGAIGWRLCLNWTCCHNGSPFGMPVLKH